MALWYPSLMMKAQAYATACEASGDEFNRGQNGCERD
jgi:hypothetical protein